MKLNCVETNSGCRTLDTCFVWQRLPLWRGAFFLKPTQCAPATIAANVGDQVQGAADEVPVYAQGSDPRYAR